MGFRHPASVSFGPLLLGLACVTWSGCNDCDFTEIRCNGNVVEQCGGVDQQIGRTVQRTPCAGLNPVCVQATPARAICATSAEARCSPGSGRCEDNVVIQCREGFEVATDCTQVKEVVAGMGAVPAMYRCTAPPGATAECRKPVN
jgi:hypothetical protein